MDRQQYDRYLEAAATCTEPVLRAEELTQVERTLAYGYDTERFTWHAYLMNAQLHVLLYRSAGAATADGRFQYQMVDHLQGQALRLDVLRPNKRVYPEHCDLEFADVMRRRDAALPFTTFDPRQWENKKDLVFKGLVHTEFGHGVATSRL